MLPFCAITDLGLILFSSLTFVWSSELRLNYFTRCIGMENKIYTNGLIKEIKIERRLQCVTRCNQNGNCNLVLYNSQTHQCRLYDHNPGQVDSEDLNGWQCFGAVSCGAPDAVANSNVTFTTTTFNSIATYSCERGYNFQGTSPDAVCRETGQWTGFVGSCVIVSCGVAAKLTDADRAYTTLTYMSTTTYSCHESYHFAGVGPVFDVICHASGLWSSLPGNCSNIKDCTDILLANGSAHDGIYVIRPTVGSGKTKVYCDMTNNGGGWTVLQRRTDGSETFYRYWYRYENGFGNLSNEFWLGNKDIYRITSQRNYQLRFDLEDFSGDERYALYSQFYICDKGQNYRLSVSGYTGDAGDSFASYHNGSEFTTRDVDNDQSNFGNCARINRGAWWYNSCHESNLNGVYNDNAYSDGVNWFLFRGFFYSLKSASIKIRPT